MIIEQILLVLTVSSTALITGLFWGWAVSVIPGLKLVNDMEYLKTMQSINRAILNPIFLITFVGSPILLIVSSIFSYDDASQFILVLSSAIIIIVGQFMVTAGRNVPLNDRLEKINLAALSEDEAAKIRGWYETPWNRWHYIRTVASLVGLVLLIIALIKT